MIPLMVGILKLDQHKTHGTSLVGLVFTGVSGAIAYGMKGTVDVTASVLMAATAIVTARAGAHYAHAMTEWKLKRSVIRRFSYVRLDPVAPQTILAPYSGNGRRLAKDHRPPVDWCFHRIPFRYDGCWRRHDHGISHGAPCRS